MHVLQKILSREETKKTNVSRLYLFTLSLFTVITLIAAVYFGNDALECLLSWLFGIRCIIPNNYFVWEATRPISDCQFCINVTKPIIFQNATRDEFSQYAYTSKPVVVKQAFLHWPAYKVFDFQFFKNLYARFEDGVRSVDEECQFLHFKSDFVSLQDVFEMSHARSKNLPDEKSWYVGWGNCHPQILKELRKFYTKPQFLPEDCEMPAKDYVFMGFDAGATMHLDFINRLMWQAQLKGSKTWRLLPSNECEDVCAPVTFKVEPGDAVLVDTRVWYHGTTITPGEFSLSIQSEYG